jgi:hypothetical protein
LPVATPEPPPRSYADILDEARRAASRRRQLIAVLAVALVTIVLVLIFARMNSVSPARRQAAPVLVEP